MAAAPSPPAGKSILIVEDEWLVSSTLAAALDAAGHIPLGPVGDLHDARRLLAIRRPDLALVDFQLRSSTSEELLPLLRELEVPTAVMTGYDAAVLPESCQGYPILQKPFGMRKLLTMVDNMR